jgi:predicted nicotinamide N-methyase
MSKLRLRYQTIELAGGDIHLRTLRDNQQFSDDDGEAEALGISSAIWPLFGIVWESGKVLAKLMASENIEGLRILEVGCGIGLASLVLKQRGADITATDYHPEAGAFLAENGRLNGFLPIQFTRTGWADLDDDLGKFDLIVGSDLLYEPGCVALLSEYIRRHCNEDCRVIMLDPKRGHLGNFTSAMMAMGFNVDSKERISQELSDSYKGWLTTYSHSKQS